MERQAPDRIGLGRAGGGKRRGQCVVIGEEGRDIGAEGNARRAGQMRMYSTKLLNDFGAKTPVEMSVTFIDNRSEPELGFIIRDISRVDAMRKAPVQTNEDSSRNVMELVGSATLKEIVSETTDVVEKMCIETAVSLTRNNRVAAAEMLGLSRQSLYVKLRKYGLLNKDGDGD